MNHVCSALAVGLLAILSACAPIASRHIEVFVVDDLDGRPIAGATVNAGRGDVKHGPFDPWNYSVSTDSNGRAECRVLEYHTNELPVWALGYAEYRTYFACPEELAIATPPDPSQWHPIVHPAGGWPRDTSIPARFDVRLTRRTTPTLVVAIPPGFEGMLCLRWGTPPIEKDKNLEVYRIRCSPGGLVIAPRHEDLRTPRAKAERKPDEPRGWNTYEDLVFDTNAGAKPAAPGLKYANMGWGGFANDRDDHTLGWVGSPEDESKLNQLIMIEGTFGKALEARVVAAITADGPPVTMARFLAIRKQVEQEFPNERMGQRESK